MSSLLQDIGERQIVSKILPRYSSATGDDCAVLDFPDKQLVVTTDPVPEPAAKLLGNDQDLYWMGWLLVVINASDLAAGGASPVALVTAIEAPPSLPVDDFERLLQGVIEGCNVEGLAYVGGNLREGSKVAAVGTAIGSCAPGVAIRRTGAIPGDVLVSVGTGGTFWQDALILRAGGRLVDKNLSPLFRPRSQLQAMSSLAQEGLIAAAIDNSDGLLPSVTQLASANSLRIEVDLQRLPEPQRARELNIDPARLWLGWGDWNVVAAIHPENVERAIGIAADAGSSIIPIGTLLNGAPQVLLSRRGETRLAPRLESERFAKDSWFAGGIETYIQALVSAELPL